MASTQNLVDLYGNGYEFGIHHFDAPWAEVPGIYVFAKWVAGMGCMPIYIGKADSFKSRLCASHECWLPAAMLGATHVLARVVSDSVERAHLEQRLIQAYRPPLNVQHNRGSGRA